MWLMSTVMFVVVEMLISLMLVSLIWTCLMKVEKKMNPDVSEAFDIGDIVRDKIEVCDSDVVRHEVH